MPPLAEAQRVRPRGPRRPPTTLSLHLPELSRRIHLQQAYIEHPLPLRPRVPLPLRNVTTHAAEMRSAKSRPAVKLIPGKQGVSPAQRAMWEKLSAEGTAPRWMINQLSRLPPTTLDVDVDNEADFPPLSGSKAADRAKESPGLESATISELSTGPSSPEMSRLESASTYDTQTTRSSNGEIKVHVIPKHSLDASPLDRFVSPSHARNLNGRRANGQAAPFIPQWLRTLPTPLQRLVLPARRPFPALDYAKDYFAPRHFRSLTMLGKVCASFTSLLPHTGPVARLNAEAILAEPSLYAKHFTSLLSLAFQTQIAEANDSTLYITRLRVHADARTSTNNVMTTFRVQIPGVREDMPKLAIGDKLELRGLDPVYKLAKSEVVEAEVVGLTKAIGAVYLKSTHLASIDSQLPKDRHGEASYQIRFAVSVEPVCAMQDAVCVSVLIWVATLLRHVG